MDGGAVLPRRRPHVTPLSPRSLVQNRDWLPLVFTVAAFDLKRGVAEIIAAAQSRTDPARPSGR